MVLEKVFDGDFFIFIKPHLSEGLVLFMGRVHNQNLKRVLGVAR